jgi:hypothetical protein
MGVSCRGKVPFSVLFVLLLVSMLPAGARAQTAPVTNPRNLVFTPSADHNALLGDGRAAVDHYVFEVYAVGAAQPFQTTNIGKPAPAADGSIYYDFSGGVASWPLPGGNYEARVSALGPSGTGLSDPSNPFTFTSCSFALSGTSASVPAAGGGTQATVTTGSGCSWTAVSNASWIALSSGGGTGSGTVVATIDPNTSSSARTGTLAVAGQTFTVNQQGAVSCTYTLSSTAQSVAATGGSGTVGVSSGTGCAWAAVSGATWVSVAPASGTGNGTVSYTVAANTGAARSATLTIGGKAFTVSQAGISVPSTPTPANPSSGATGVDTMPTLTWTASGAASYAISFGTANPPTQQASGLTIPSYAPAALTAGTTYYWQVVATNVAGSTTGPVWSFTTAAATTPLPAPWASRDIGTVVLSGSASHASGTFTVTGSGADIWGTADAFQFAYQTLSGSGQIVARLTGEQNTNAAAKAAVMMRQSLNANSRHVTLDVTPGSTVELMRRSSTGGSTSRQATTTQVPPAWLKLARSGNTFTASVSADGTTWRTVGSTTTSLGTTIYVGLAVTSHDTTKRNAATFDNVSVGASGSCTYALSGTSASLPAAGGGTQTSVTTASGCSWTAVSNVPWITLSTSGATGSATVVATVAANTGTAARTGTFTVAGGTFTVQQAGVACSFSITSSSQSVGAAGATGTTGVTTQSGCTWTAVSNAAWITVTSGASGSGNGTVGFTVAANTGTAARTGTLTVAGQTLTVQEAGASTGMPTLSITGGSALAGNSPLTFLVTLSAPSTSTVSVGYVTVSGTATNGVDYYGMSGTLTFSPGVTTQTITVWLQASSTAGEYFYMDLSNPVNATMAVSRATGTIR